MQVRNAAGSNEGVHGADRAAAAQGLAVNFDCLHVRSSRADSTKPRVFGCKKARGSGESWICGKKIED